MPGGGWTYCCFHLSLPEGEAILSFCRMECNCLLLSQCGARRPLSISPHTAVLGPCVQV